MPVKPTPEGSQQVLQLLSGHIISSSLNVVAHLDIAGRLAGGPRTVADLARDCNVNEDALYRVLRALASLGVFVEESPRTFNLTPAAAALQEGAVRRMALWIASPFALRVY